LVYPGIQFKAIKGNTLLSDANFNEIRPYLGVKAVPVHAQVAGRVPEAEQARKEKFCLFHVRCYCFSC